MASNDLERAYEYLNTSPMFKFSLSSKELFHSNFLEWLSNVDSNAFMKLVNRKAGLKDDYKWPNVWRVKREYNNFDLCIVAYDQHADNSDDISDSDENFWILFVIENKVKSIPYTEQLIKYSNKAELINNKYWNNKAKDELPKRTIRDANEGKAQEKVQDDFDWIGVDKGGKKESNCRWKESLVKNKNL